MTKISRDRLDARHLGFFLNNFWSLITLLENKEQVKDFLKDLLTHTEMTMFAKRIQIAKMLLEGFSYQEIKARVKVTDPTIARISNLLATGGEGLKTAVEYLKKMETKIEQERLRAMPDIEKKYSAYFLPDRLIDATENKLKTFRKRSTIKQDIKL